MSRQQAGAGSASPRWRPVLATLQEIRQVAARESKRMPAAQHANLGSIGKIVAVATIDGFMIGCRYAGWR
ncbi:MAG: hypothetical protein ABW203_03985 [Novosphingobium sp.]